MTSLQLSLAQMRKQHGFTWIFLGILALVLMLLLDVFYFRGRIFNKEIPTLTPSNILRSIVTIGSISLVFYGLISLGKSNRHYLRRRFGSLSTMAVFANFMLSLSFLLLFVLAPDFFSLLSLEDQIIEWTSFGFLMLGFGLFMYTAWRYRKNPFLGKFVIAGISLVSLGLFIIGMEEISWFQRVLEVQTPEFFEGNWQGEMNFHNFSTNWAENIYYFGVFVFFVVLPLIQLLFPNILKRFNIHLLVPSTFVAICAAIPFAYNYSMWNTLTIQISFFGSLAVLIVMFLLSTNQLEKKLIVGTLLLAVTTQLIFLVNGDLFMRDWEVTEYKELLIPFVFLIYWIDLQNRLRNSEKRQSYRLKLNSVS